MATTYLPAYNREFRHQPESDGSAFVPGPDNLDDFLVERFDRVVRKDNCVQFEGLTLQIPADRHRCHYIKAKVKVLRHMDGTLSIFHGPRRLARYDRQGREMTRTLPVAA